MKRLARTILFLAVLLCGAFSISAQQISFTAEVDRNTVEVGDRITYTASINTNADITEPNFGGLQKIAGPQQGTQMTNVNGRVSMSFSRTWVLTATKAGDYTIGPSVARIGGGNVQTDPVKIHVTQGGGSSDQADRAQRSDQNIFITFALSKSKAYVGEQVIASWTLYSRYDNVSRNPPDIPSMNGFWSEDVPLNVTKWDDQMKNINGIRYYTATLYRKLLVPQRSGTLRIEQSSFPMIVTGRDSWGFPRQQQVTVMSNAATLEAIPLPGGAPAGFTGAVGELHMDVKADPMSLKANEAIDVSVHLSGESNLKLLDAPKLSLPSDMETYDPKVVDKISVTGGGMSGSREFQYLVIPRHEGDYTIPPITVAYFDLGSRSYRTLSSDTLHVHVAKGDGSSATISRPTQRDVEQLGSDIRYIRTGELSLRAKDEHLFGSWGYLAGIAAPPIAFLLFFGWHRRRERALADTVGQRRKGADRVARQRLKAAADALGKNDREGFYQALGKALEGYFADKFALGVAGVNAAMVKEKLGPIDDGQSATRYNELLELCGMARFAPVESKPRQQLYDEAAALIGRIETSIRS